MNQGQQDSICIRLKMRDHLAFEQCQLRQEGFWLWLFQQNMEPLLKIEQGRIFPLRLHFLPFSKRRAGLTSKKPGRPSAGMAACSRAGHREDGRLFKKDSTSNFLISLVCCLHLEERLRITLPTIPASFTSRWGEDSLRGASSRHITRLGKANTAARLFLCHCRK